MDAYSDALSIWNDIFQYKYLNLIEALPIIGKYKIELRKPINDDDAFPKVDEINKMIILNKIWLAGEDYLNNAENIYKEADKKIKVKK